MGVDDQEDVPQISLEDSREVPGHSRHNRAQQGDNEIKNTRVTNGVSIRQPNVVQHLQTAVPSPQHQSPSQCPATITTPFSPHKTHQQLDRQKQTDLGANQRNSSIGSTGILHIQDSACQNGSNQVNPASTINLVEEDSANSPLKSNPPSVRKPAFVTDDPIPRQQGQNHEAYTSRRQQRGSTQNGKLQGQYNFRVDTSVSQNHSSSEIPLPWPQSKGALLRRSRYSTLPENIDQAVILLVDELESSVTLKKSVQYLEKKVQALEQDIKIRDGQALLAQQAHNSHLSRENASLRVEATAKQRELEWLQEQNQELKQELEQLREHVKKCEENMSSWKRMMKSMIDG